MSIRLCSDPSGGSVVGTYGFPTYRGVRSTTERGQKGRRMVNVHALRRPDIIVRCPQYGISHRPLAVRSDNVRYSTYGAPWRARRQFVKKETCQLLL